MIEHPFLIKRFIQLIDYPGSSTEKGFIFIATTEKYLDEFVNRYPDVYGQLKWWEKRSIDQMMSVEYVRITEYTGYWIVGDIVKVTDYKIDTSKRKFDHFILGGGRWSLPGKCIPATKEEFDIWEKLKKH